MFRPIETGSKINEEKIRPFLLPTTTRSGVGRTVGTKSGTSSGRFPAAANRPDAFGEPALALRGAARALAAQVADDVERLRFNVAVAHVYEFANAFAAAVSAARGMAQVPADLAYALREAAQRAVLVIAPMTPHLAEECWAALGHEGLVAQAGWPRSGAARPARATALGKVIASPVV